MAQRGNVVPVATDPTVHFTGTLAAGESRLESIVIPEAIAAGKHCRAIVRQVHLLSRQQLAWELAFFGRTTADESNLARNAFFGRQRFVSTDGVQFSAGGPFYFVVQDVGIPYEDFDQLGRLNVLLINRSATAKLAGDAGAVKIRLLLEATLGW